MPKHRKKPINTIEEDNVEFNAKAAREIQEIYNKQMSAAEKHFLEHILSLMPIESLEDRKKSLYLIAEMFKGAQIHIKGTEAYNTWTAKEYQPFLFSRQGSSSHESKQEQFAIRGKLFAENLLGTRIRKDKNNQEYSWFQLERHPAGSADNKILNKISNTLLHLLDYIVYKFTGENVGPYGTSKYKEKNPCYAEEHFGKELTPSPINKSYWTNMLFKNPSLEFDLSKDPKRALETAKKPNNIMLSPSMISKKPTATISQPIKALTPPPKKLKED